MTGVRKGKKRKVVEEADETVGGRDELVSLENIEMIYGRKKNDKEARMASVKEGRKIISPKFLLFILILDNK